MNEDNVVTFRQPDEIDDALTEVLRAGARRLLAQAVDAEVAAFLAEHSALKLDDGRQRVVRHGHAPERMIRTGIGPVTVAPPRVRDRGAAVDGRIRFTSAILPRWARRTKSLDALLPVLYLRGLSSGDFRDALRPRRLSALSGADAQCVLVLIGGHVGGQEGAGRLHRWL
jgi:putative transposase